jgi:hypothetical protein
VNPRDLELLRIAANGAPGRGVRITARRGMWAKNGVWNRFESEATIAGFVSLLDDEAVELEHGNLCIWVRFGDIEYVTDDVSLMELARKPTVAEALALRGALGKDEAVA